MWRLIRYPIRILLRSSFQFNSHLIVRTTLGGNMKRTRRSNTRHAMPTTASTSSSSPDSSEDVKPAAVVSKYFTRARRRSFTQSQVVDGTPSSAETASDLSPKKRGRIVQKQPKKEMADKSARDIKSESSSDQVADIEDYAASSSNVFIYRDQKFKLPWIPRHFQRMWDNIEQMRNQEPAPVDTMGCAHCHDEEELDERIKRLQSLVALMLSSQTRDEINFQAMKRLKKRHLSVQWLLNIDESALANLIKPVSFHNQKAKNLKKTAQILRDDYDDDIPDTVESLCRLPGVGPKMAHLTMMCAWNQVTGIAVDTHVHRIVNRLHWVKKETKTPEQTMKDLESWVPKQLWFELNENLVGFGQTICAARNPACDRCLNQPICPFANKQQK